MITPHPPALAFGGRKGERVMGDGESWREKSCRQSEGVLKMWDFKPFEAFE
jgi:hypothetical protein